MDQAGLTEVVAILTEFSRCLLEIFDVILLFLCFVLEFHVQMYMLPKSRDMNKMWLWS